MGRPKKHSAHSVVNLSIVQPASKEVTTSTTEDTNTATTGTPVVIKPAAPPRPTMKPLNDTFKLTISKELLEKIEYLCGYFPNVEWSGTLYYKITGDINSPDFAVEAIDLYLQDIGSPTYTEYEFSEDYAGFLAEHPELRGADIYEGHIHSHNTMATFFSGTDDGELIDSAILRKNILSLIVNNAGVYTAALGTLATAEVKQTTSYKYPLFTGEEITFETEVSKEMPVVFKRMAVIEKRAPNSTLKGLFDPIISAIKARKEARTVHTAASKYPYTPSTSTPSLYPASGTYPNFRSSYPNINHSNYASKSNAVNARQFDDVDDDDFPRNGSIINPRQSNPTPLVYPYTQTSQEALQKGEAKKKEVTIPYEAHALLLITKSLACSVLFKGTISEALSQIPIGLSVEEYRLIAANSFDDVLGWILDQEDIDTQLGRTIVGEHICAAALELIKKSSLMDNAYGEVIYKFIQDCVDSDDLPESDLPAIIGIK